MCPSDLDTSRSGEQSEPPGGRMPVHSRAAVVEEDRPGTAAADGTVDGPAHCRGPVKPCALMPAVATTGPIMMTAARGALIRQVQGRLILSHTMSCGERVRGEGASSVTEILTEPVSAANVWRGDELADGGRWIIRFAEEDFADFERALAHVSKMHIKDVTEIRAEDFPLSHFQERIDDIVDRLEHGPGLVLLRGLPIYDRFSEDEATIIYWGMGRHMGNLVAQNRKGDLVGHIRDLGRRGPYERAYATNEDLGFHTDSTDFVGLMCLRPALHGGESFVASSGLLYNFVVGEQPEYLPILNKNFPTDWRSEEPPGSPGWYLEPLYSYFGGTLSATVRTGRAISAMRFPEVPRLTADEVSCFIYFESLPKRPGVALGMQLQTGDLQFLNNFVTVHTRTAFVDDAEDPARQRHLLRLWISRPETGRPLCPEYAAWRSGYPT
jgi:hypothetical protein